MSCDRTIRFLVFFLYCLVSTQAWAQSQESSEHSGTEHASLVPYRRLFVKRADLESFDPISQGYVLRDLNLVSELLKPYLVKQDEAQGYHRLVELKSALYVSKLIGSNLVSSKSKIVASRGSVLNEVLRLQPWSLAITPLPQPPISSIDTGLMTPDRLAFDRAGIPLFDLHTESASDAIAEQVVEFAWSARGVSKGPNRLVFQAEIPRCIDSGLLISLPPQARIVDATVPSRLIANWADLESRLGERLPEAKQQLERQAGTTNLDTLWFLELGGVDRFSFTIVIHSNINTNDALATGIDTLILEQRIDHTFSLENVLSTCSVDLQRDRKSDRPIRVKLTSDTLLRRVSSGAREIDWRIEDGFLVIDPSVLNALASSRESRLPMQIEYLSSLDSRGELPRELPDFLIPRGFVLKGQTSLRFENGIHLDSISIPSSCVIDNSESNRLNVEWWDYSPAFQVHIQKDTTPSTLSSSTHLNDSEESFQVSVKLTRSDFAKSDFRFRIAEGWTLDEIDAINGSKGIPWEMLSDANATIQEFRVLRDSIPSTANGLEFKISLTDPMVTGELVFPPQGWIQTDSSSNRRLFAIESIGKRFSMPSFSLDRIVPAETNPAPASNARETTSAAMLLELKPDDELRFPKLERRSASRGSIFSEIERLGRNILRVKYRFVPPLGENVSVVTQQSPKLHAPSHWSYLANQQWHAFDELEKTPESNSSRTYRLPLIDGTSVNWQLEEDIYCDQLPVKLQLPNFDPLAAEQYQLKIPPDLSILNSDPDDAWEVDQAGNYVLNLGQDRKFLEIGNAPRTAQSVFDLNRVELKTDIALDHRGIARGYCQLLLSDLAAKTVRVTLAPEWNLELDSVAVEQGRQFVWTETRETESVFQIHKIKSTENGNGETVISFIVTKDLRNDVSKHLGHDTSLTLEPFFISLDNSRILPTSGTVWTPEDLSRWRLMKHHTHLQGQRIWSPTEGVSWWSEWFESIFGLQSGTHRNTDRDALPSRLLEVMPPAFWNRIYQWESPEELTTLQWNNVALEQRWSAFLFVIAAISSTWILASRAVYLLLIFTLGFGCYAASIQTSMLEAKLSLEAILSGLFFGAVFFKLIQITKMTFKKTENKHSSRSAPWEGSNQVWTRQVVQMIIASACLPWLQSNPIIAQDSRRPISATYDLIIPIDDTTGEPTDSVYIPEILLNAMRGVPTPNYLTLNARHTLRLSPRSRSASMADQLILRFDLWVGKISEPISFPILSVHGSLLRFIVDETEFTTSNRVQRRPTEIIWLPERTGKRRVEIVLSPVMTSVDVEDLAGNGGKSIQSFEFGTLPSANATLEIESADPQMQLEVESLGGITNPLPGRFVVAVGNQEKIAGRLRFPNPVGSVPSSTTNPYLVFEFFMQGDSVRARSVLRIPPEAFVDKQYELEADSAWMPLGTNWGSTRLVETKNASSFWRRRYVFERDLTNQESTDEASQSYVLWGLRDNSTNIHNVVFAECMDVRVRPQAIRFARLAGAEWSIDQVKDLEPILNEKERLDWPEFTSLKLAPPATSLRINPQGGVLKRTQRSDKLQLRIATRWYLLDDVDTVESRIEVFGTANSDILELFIPENYRVVEAKHRLGSFQICQLLDTSRSDRKRIKVQLIAERQQWANTDINLRLESRLTPTDSPLESPWIDSPAPNISSEAVEIVANESWKVILKGSDLSTRILYGRGPTTPIASLSRNETISKVARKPVLQNEVSAQIIGSDTGDRQELVLQGRCSLDSNSLSKFIVQIPFPISDSDEWRSDRSAIQIPCPVVGHSWIQLDLGLPEESESVKNWTLQVGIPREFQAYKDWATPIRFLGGATIDIKPADSNDQSDSSTSDNSRKTALSHRAVCWNSFTHGSKQRFILWRQHDNQSVRMTLDPAIEITALLVNGVPGIYSRTRDELSVFVPPLPTGFGIEILVEYVAPEPSIRPLGQDEEPGTWNSENILSKGIPFGYEILKFGSERIPLEISKDSQAEQWLRFWMERLNPLGESAVLLEKNSTILASLKELLIETQSRWPSIAWNTDPKSLVLEPARDWNAPSQKTAVETNVARPKLLLAFGSWLALCVTFWFTRNTERRPWLALVLLGTLVWVVTGFYFLAILLIGLGILLAIDNMIIYREAISASKLRKAV